ncbi:GGDEF domain-containing protein [Undibacterium sp. Ren11W]|uniref:GGDEF domain-containing protein n=1 Tax=Undibacterium sp. Ren11W TaxID=3413045 RepID=UPI003BEF686B
MLRLHRPLLIVTAVALLLCLVAYASMGTLKPMQRWQWMDIAGEGGSAIMAGIWLLMLLSSRPKGRVTTLLAAGLAAIMLGESADCLDEFFTVPKEQLWDNFLEAALMLGGMLTLTSGMYYWRQEQFRLNEHLQKRERLFRSHRAFDRLTQLATAEYLREQIEQEQQRQPLPNCAVVLLDIDGFHLINRHFGQPQGDLVLQAVGHMLLLNLRNEDLLCRYAGDRFAILMPETSLASAESMAQHLCFMVRHMQHRSMGQHIDIRIRHACAMADAPAETVLTKLNRVLDTSTRECDALAAA